MQARAQVHKASTRERRTVHSKCKQGYKDAKQAHVKEGQLEQERIEVRAKGTANDVDDPATPTSSQTSFLSSARRAVLGTRHTHGSRICSNCRQMHPPTKCRQMHPPTKCRQVQRHGKAGEAQRRRAKGRKARANKNPQKAAKPKTQRKSTTLATHARKDIRREEREEQDTK